MKYVTASLFSLLLYQSIAHAANDPANFTGSWVITAFGDDNISDGTVIEPSALEVEISASSDSARDLDVTLTEGPNSGTLPLDIFTETMAQLPVRPIPLPGSILVDLVILSNGNVMALAFVVQENFDPLDISFRIGAWQKTSKPITRNDFIGNWRISEDFGDPNLRATAEGFSLDSSGVPFSIRAGTLSNTILLKSGLFSIELRVDGNRAFLPSPINTADGRHLAFNLVHGGDGMAMTSVGQELDDETDISLSIGTAWPDPIPAILPVILQLLD